MPADNRCPRCGARRPATAPAGLCPQCLLRLGLGDDLSNSHEGSPTTSRSAGGPTASALDVLTAAAGPLPRVALHETEAPPTEPLESPGSPEIPAPADRTARLQLFGEIARGGMGAILRGRDPDLGREVAVKVLLERHRDKPELVHRFVEEAQIAGQLQHPGVVPVYELGALGGSRPYFVMKLVKGRTFAALLSERRGLADGLPGLLTVFSQVAETVAYAHSRGVIHRDLKPSNVMVGSFGEVQVMDWGLSKVLRRGGTSDDETAGKLPDPETALATARSGSDADRSLAGSVMGTPAYMAPEQARGEVDRLDERIDVFALGSILCEMLTGRPAFTGRDTAEIQRRAARGDTADALARLEGSGADVELVTLARDCLAADRGDRPRDAGAVAARVTAHLQGVQQRLRAAELARVEAQARAEEEAKRRELSDRLAAEAQARAAEERARRRLTVALAASVLSIALLGAGGAAWYARDRADRIAGTAREVNKALDEATTMLGQARSAPVGDFSKWVEATEAAKRAASVLAQGHGTADLRARLDNLLAAVTRGHVAARARAEEDRAKAAEEEEDRLMVERLLEITTDLSVHRDFRRRDAAYAGAFRDYGIDVDALDTAAAAERIAARPIAADLAGALDNWAHSRRTRLVPPDREGARRLTTVARLADADPWRNRLRDVIDRMEVDKDGALAECKKLAATVDPAALPVHNLHRLASTLSDLGDHEGSVALLRVALRLHPDYYWFNSDMGMRLLMIGDQNLPEALRYYTAALAVRPRSSHALGRIGYVLHRMGRDEEAAATLRRALEFKADEPGSDADLGSLLVASGKRAEAEFREAKRLKPDDPGTLNNIGAAWSYAGYHEEAVREFREALRFKSDDPMVHSNLGITLWKLGRVEESLSEFREALQLEPGSTPTRFSLGSLLAESGRFEEAADAFREVVRRAPKNPQAHHGLGGALYQLGRFAEARDSLRQGDDLASTGNTHFTSNRIKDCDRMLALEPRLPALLKGDDRPADSAECADFARLCHIKRHYATAARLWEEAFAARPALADDLTVGYRYDAACDAALAAAGKGKDDPPSDAEARARLRGQARDWLGAELTAWSRLLASGPSQARPVIVRSLRHWRSDPDLTVVRDPDALTSLPEPERAKWRALWADVEALLKRAEGQTP